MGCEHAGLVVFSVQYNGSFHTCWYKKSYHEMQNCKI